MKIAAFILRKEDDSEKLEKIYVQLIILNEQEIEKLDSIDEIYEYTINKQSYPDKIINLSTYMNLLHKAKMTITKKAKSGLLFSILDIDEEIIKNIKEDI